MSRPMCLAAAAFCALLPISALADPTAEQAQALQQELRGWVENTYALMPAFLNDLSFQVAPEADHYRASIRLNGVPWVSDVQGGDLSVAAQELPAGRWMLYDFRFASPFRFRTDLPPMPMGTAGTEVSGPLDFLLSFRKLNWDAILDPSFATPSILNTTLDDYEIASTAGKAQQHSHIGTLTGEASLIPAANGRIDIRDDAAAEDFSIVAKGPEPQQSPALFLGRVEVSGKIAGLDPDRVAPLVRSLSEGPPVAGMEEKRIDSRWLRLLYTKVRGIATGGEFSETLDDLRAEMGGHMVALSHMRLGGGVDVQNGTLTGHVIVAVDGITAPDIPAPVQGYVPRHVLVRPTFSGIDLADLDALIMAITAPGPEPRMEQPEIAEHIKAMFAHGGIAAGLEALEIDLGSTRFGATGKVTALSLDHFRGEADVTAVGFDALVAQVQSSREWGKAAPFLQLLGKLGRPDGERIVWTITADNADVKVNGLDIPALIAASKGR